jgi:hypothetical protein
MKLLRDIFSIASGISIFIVLGKMILGQIKAKTREEFVLENLKDINKSLNGKMGVLGGKLDAIAEDRVACREEMGDRVSKIEGKLNGRR